MDRKRRAQVMHAGLIDRTVVPRDSRETPQVAEGNVQGNLVEGFAVFAGKEAYALAGQTAKAAFVSSQSCLEVRTDGNRSRAERSARHLS